MSDSTRLTRQELYDRVWSTPAWKLGPELGLSGRGLAKRCAREGIPVPQRGYWAKLQVGKGPARTPLVSPWPPEVSPKPHAPRVDDEGWHLLIDRVREHLTVGRKTDGGYLKPRKRLILDVYVTEKALSSALELANALFVALEERDHPVVIASESSYGHRPDVDEREKGGRERYSGHSWSPARPTVTTIGTVAFGLTVYEISEDVEVQYLDGETWTPWFLRNARRADFATRFRTIFWVSALPSSWQRTRGPRMCNACP